MLNDISNRHWTAAQYAIKYNGSQEKEAIKDIISQVYNLHK